MGVFVTEEIEVKQGKNATRVGSVAIFTRDQSISEKGAGGSGAFVSMAKVVRCAHRAADGVCPSADVSFGPYRCMAVCVRRTNITNCVEPAVDMDVICRDDPVLEPLRTDTYREFTV